MSVRPIPDSFRPYCPACGELLSEEAGRDLAVYRAHVHECASVTVRMQKHMMARLGVERDRLAAENERLRKFLTWTGKIEGQGFPWCCVCLNWRPLDHEHISQEEHDAIWKANADDLARRRKAIQEEIVTLRATCDHLAATSQQYAELAAAVWTERGETPDPSLTWDHARTVARAKETAWGHEQAFAAGQATLKAEAERDRLLDVVQAAGAWADAEVAVERAMVQMQTETTRSIDLLGLMLLRDGKAADLIAAVGAWRKGETA